MSEEENGENGENEVEIEPIITSEMVVKGDLIFANLPTIRNQIQDGFKGPILRELGTGGYRFVHRDENAQISNIGNPSADFPTFIDQLEDGFENFIYAIYVNYYEGQIFVIDNRTDPNDGNGGDGNDPGSGSGIGLALANALGCVAHGPIDIVRLTEQLDGDMENNGEYRSMEDIISLLNTTFFEVYGHDPECDPITYEDHAGIIQNVLDQYS